MLCEGALQANDCPLRDVWSRGTVGETARWGRVAEASPAAAGGRSFSRTPGTRSSPGAVGGRRPDGVGAAGGRRLGAPNGVDG